MERGGVGRKHESIQWVKGERAPVGRYYSVSAPRWTEPSGRIPFFVQRKTWLQEEEEEEEEGRWMEIGNGK